MPELAVHAVARGLPLTEPEVGRKRSAFAKCRGKSLGHRRAVLETVA